MDPTQFDQFTKVLAHSTSRRRAFKGLVTATVGGLFGLRTLQKSSPVAAEGEDSVIIANRNNNVATSGSMSAAMGGNASAQTSSATLSPSRGPVMGCLPFGSRVPGGCNPNTVALCCSDACSPIAGDICV